MSFETPNITSPPNYEEQSKKLHYNQVMKSGNRIDISGQDGWDQDLAFTYKSRQEEIENAFENVQRVLNSVGSSWKDVHSVNSYHVPLDSECTALMPQLFKKYIGDRRPLWTCVGVQELAEPEMHIEIVVTAFTNSETTEGCHSKL